MHSWNYELANFWHEKKNNTSRRKTTTRAPANLPEVLNSHKQNKNENVWTFFYVVHSNKKKLHRKKMKLLLDIRRRTINIIHLKYRKSCTSNVPQVLNVHVNENLNKSTFFFKAFWERKWDFFLILFLILIYLI